MAKDEPAQCEGEFLKPYTVHKVGLNGERLEFLEHYDTEEEARNFKPPHLGLTWRIFHASKVLPHR